MVGAGVAGLTAGYLLQREYDVTLYEVRAAPRWSRAHPRRRHAATVGSLPIDSGFIVHNRSTYPNLLRLFGELGVETQPTDMSMSVRCDGCGLEYAGARGLGGVFAQPANAANPRVPADARRGQALPPRRRSGSSLAPSSDGADGASSPSATSSHAGRYSAVLRPALHGAARVVRVVVPAPHRARATRRATCSRFLDHHGVLQRHRLARSGAPWSVGRAATSNARRRSSPPPSSRRRCAACAAVPDGVEIRDDADAHPHVRRRGRRHPRRRGARAARRPDAGASARRWARSGPRPTRPCCTPTARCSRRRRVPGRRGTTCSTRAASDAGAVHVSYDMNRLHRLDEPRRLRRHAEPGDRIADDAVHRPHALHAPGVHRGVGRRAGRAPRARTTAGSRSPAPTTGGASTKTAARSGVRAAASLGVELVTAAPVLYRTRIAHGRTERVRARLRVPARDVAGRPRRASRRCRAVCACSARFDARDHLGDPDATIRANVDAYLADRGRRPRRRPRAHARERRARSATRSTRCRVFWCYDRDGELGVRRSPRCTTPTASATATCCGPTPAAAPAPTRSSTCRRSSRSTARYEMRVHRPAVRRPRASRSRCARGPIGPCSGPSLDRSGRHRRAVVPPRRAAAPVRRASGSWRSSSSQGIRLWLRRLPVVPRPRRARSRNGVHGMSREHSHSTERHPRAPARARGRTSAPAPVTRPVHTAIARALFHRVVPASRGAGRAPRRPARSAAAAPTRRSCASAATRSSAASAPTASSASASRSWPATGTPTTPPRCWRRSRRACRASCPRGCSGCGTSTCGTSPRASRTPGSARAATSRGTTTCRTSCSRCSSTRR